MEKIITEKLLDEIHSKFLKLPNSSTRFDVVDAFSSSMIKLGNALNTIKSSSSLVDGSLSDIRTIKNLYSYILDARLKYYHSDKVNKHLIYAKDVLSKCDIWKDVIKISESIK